MQQGVSVHLFTSVSVVVFWARQFRKKKIFLIDYFLLPEMTRPLILRCLWRRLLSIVKIWEAANFNNSLIKQDTLSDLTPPVCSRALTPDTLALLTASHAAGFNTVQAWYYRFSDKRTIWLSVNFKNIYSHMIQLQITWILVQIMRLGECLLCFTVKCCTNSRGKKELMRYRKMQLVNKSRQAPFGAGVFPTLLLLGLFTQFVRLVFKSQLKY